jgi:hypothetical protein
MIAQPGNWPRKLGNDYASRGTAAQIGEWLRNPGMMMRLHPETNENQHKRTCAAYRPPSPRGAQHIGPSRRGAQLK